MEDRNDVGAESANDSSVANYDGNAATTRIGLDVGTSKVVSAQGDSKKVDTGAQLNAFFIVPYSALHESTLQQSRVSFYREGDVVQVEVRAQDANEAPVSQQGTLTVYRLIADPSQMPRWSPENIGADVPETPSMASSPSVKSNPSATMKRETKILAVFVLWKRTTASSASKMSFNTLPFTFKATFPWKPLALCGLAELIMAAFSVITAFRWFALIFSISR